MQGKAKSFELPEALTRVLIIRDNAGLVCPEDIRVQVGKIKSRVMQSRRNPAYDSYGVRNLGFHSRSTPSFEKPMESYGDKWGGSAKSTPRGSSMGSPMGSSNSPMTWGQNRKPSVLAPRVEVKPAVKPVLNRFSVFDDDDDNESTVSVPTAALKSETQESPRTTDKPSESETQESSRAADKPSESETQESSRAADKPSESKTQESPRIADKPHVVTDDLPSVSSAPTVPGFRYKSRFKKEAASEASLDDRILGHIRAKINKFSAQNYTKVLNFLRQNMDSEEREFLQKFMALIFRKAAEEDTFVALYAQLLSDLTPEFPQLHDEMQLLFRDYLEIFGDAVGATNVSTNEYGKFLDAQQRKGHRRGYSLFIAQIATRGLIEKEQLLKTIIHITKYLADNLSNENEKLLVEELSDCLTNILSVAKGYLSGFDELNTVISDLRKFVSLPANETPGFTHKARFALMDSLGI